MIKIFTGAVLVGANFVDIKKAATVLVSGLLCVVLLAACSSRNDPVSSDGGDGTDTTGTGTSGGTDGNPGDITVGPDTPSTGGSDDFAVRGVEQVYAYRRNSPYESVLKNCLLINTVAASCPLTVLPFIGDGTTMPTIEDIMNRVLVTHDWMGERFEAVLRDAPDDLLMLFSSTTAVLMGSTVRPSYYWSLHGAIQLDPYYLWTTLDEKSSVGKQEDFRSDYGKDLQFWFLSRIANPDGNPIAPFYSLDDDSVRPPADIRLPLYRLLFHELSHATDFMPRSEIAGLNLNQSVFNAIDGVRNRWLSPQLTAEHPLLSNDLMGFAQVRYRGEDANTVQQLATAADLGNLMAADGAIQFYSYSTEKEDLAQLVEGAMMAYHYGALTNVGWTQKPDEDLGYTCADLLVAWGQRNRLADPLVNVRARFATDLVVELTPQINNYLDNSLVFSEAMEDNVNWCANQAHSTSSLTDQPGLAAGIGQRTAPVEGTLFREMLEAERRRHHVEGLLNR